MPWLKFTKVFAWRPVTGRTILYKPGHIVLETTRCATAAIAAGVAERTIKPKRANGHQDPKPPAA